MPLRALRLLMSDIVLLLFQCGERHHALAGIATDNDIHYIHRDLTSFFVEKDIMPLRALRRPATGLVEFSIGVEKDIMPLRALRPPHTRRMRQR